MVRCFDHPEPIAGRFFYLIAIMCSASSLYELPADGPPRMLRKEAAKYGFIFGICSSANKKTRHFAFHADTALPA